jgi:hypothetical protein
MSPKAPTFGEYPFEALGPGHGLMALFGCFIFVFLSGMSSASFGRRHIDTVSAIWTMRRSDKYSMEPCQVYSGLWHQRRQFADKIQRFKDDVSEGRPVVPSL